MKYITGLENELGELKTDLKTGMAELKNRIMFLHSKGKENKIYKNEIPTNI